ncbi:hypothetical protein BDV95DRAFT_598055 [Massariosphaeria phaeospora]|uniref:Uncharacterized protein n=1 Tax=Massariosphaeria phaeospora TaxID=100035 RepID=A0A7C8I8Z4_9PLEO|nr:hypothetical protein BDV95DRAFT_598055 [Massariosphaeria phaeospora]
MPSTSACSASPSGSTYFSRKASSESQSAINPNQMTIMMVRNVLRHPRVLDLMARTATINVTDLATLGSLLQKADPSHSNSMFSVGSGLSSIVPCITKLDITLRLPLSAFRTIEDLSTKGTPESPVSHESAAISASDLAAWSQLYSSITHLSGLRRLHIWLDHSDKTSWSALNERAMLLPLTPLATLPDLRVSVNLPLLNPRYTGSDRHFCEDSPPPPFPIQRSKRLINHSQYHDDCFKQVSRMIEL